MDFKQKYFKYKNKYLKLRNQETNYFTILQISK